ncbi:MAG: MBL fold metallo-hydrolase [Ruminococcaceae bacterium]|nr:MBL fold metallo-hydrolase [Oscillospiraceae bacterium]
MKITFIGATHEVTGSCTLVECGGYRILIDCGMEQGADVFENIELPISEREIDCVLLTHAHIDHSGKLPLLYKKGYRGPVYMTEATAKLSRIMLLDSASIQESEAEWKNRKSKRAGKKQYKPSYNTRDAEGLLRLIKPVSYGETVVLKDGITAVFSDMGHLLGSSAIKLTLTEGGETRTLVASGDVGNVNRPIVRDPQPVTEGDYVILETTYGDRDHGDDAPDYIGTLANCIQRTLDGGGNLVIPSFAVGRTQEMLYFIREIKQKGLVKGHDGFPVYVDSPLAVEATEVFIKCGAEYLDKEARSLVEEGVNPIAFDGLVLSVTTEQSKAINIDKTPKVIIASSGMCEAGRIRHHLKHNLWRRESMVLFVGYQSEGTLGRKIYDGAASVKLFNESIAVKCAVTYLAGISGHGDRGVLTEWLTSFRKKPRTVFLNHGEHEAMESFGARLEGMGYNVAMPYSGTSYDLITGEAAKVTEGLRLRTKAKEKPDAAEAKTKKDRRRAERELTLAIRTLNGLLGGGNISTEELLALAEEVNRAASKYDEK